MFVYEFIITLGTTEAKFFDLEKELKTQKDNIFFYFLKAMEEKNKLHK